MKTLICIRQLPYSEPTIMFGGLVASLENSPITVMTVIESKTERESAEAEIKKAETLLQGQCLTTKIREGHVAQEILSESDETQYDFIVIGAHEVARLLDDLLGTITSKVAGQASSPVLVVKGDRPAKIEQILIAIRGQKMNPKVVKEGAELARAAEAKVTVLYVTAPVPTMYTGLDELDESLQELLNTDTPIARYLRWSAQYLADMDVEADLEVVQGVASDEIMREARQGDYDLIVMGAASVLSSIRRLFIDQVTPHVLERSPCSVLVVR